MITFAIYTILTRKYNDYQLYSSKVINFYHLANYLYLFFSISINKIELEKFSQYKLSKKSCHLSSFRFYI